MSNGHIFMVKRQLSDTVPHYIQNCNVATLYEKLTTRQLVYMYTPNEKIVHYSYTIR